MNSAQKVLLSFGDLILSEYGFKVTQWLTTDDLIASAQDNDCDFLQNDFKGGVMAFEDGSMIIAREGNFRGRGSKKVRIYRFAEYVQGRNG